jgi:hypothetical protein
MARIRALRSHNPPTCVSTSFVEVDFGYAPVLNTQVSLAQVFMDQLDGD